MNQTIINIADALIESAKDRVSRAFTTAPPASGQYKEYEDLGPIGRFVLFMFNMLSRSLEVVGVLAGYLIALTLFLGIYIVDTLYRAIMGAIQGVRERRSSSRAPSKTVPDEVKIERKIRQHKAGMESDREGTSPAFVKEEFPDHDSKDDHTYDEPNVSPMTPLRHGQS